MRTAPLHQGKEYVGPLVARRGSKTSSGKGEMNDTEVVKYLEAFLSGRLPDWSEQSQQATLATLVTCMDGRLTPLMRPFRHVIRTAGAMIEPVEGSVGLGIDSTAVTFLATHGDCLAYRAAIEYLATSFAGKIADPDVVRTMNQPDTKTLLRYINTQRPLNELPDPSDQQALAELAISYAIQWTSRNRNEKPRIGLFIDLEATLSTRVQAWVVSYEQLSGPDLADFLSMHGMTTPLVVTHVLTAPRTIRALR